MSDSKIRIAIIGCGAVTEKAHLPALRLLAGVQVAVLVDVNLTRAERLAREFSVPRAATDFHAYYDEFDAAIVALPHALHAAASIALLEHGKAVLVEKPMANTVAECEAMMAAAARGRAVLAVGLMRRFLWAHQSVNRLIAGGSLGAIERFDFQEGSIFNWPVASDFQFRKESAGGGVLMDTGSHTLDCLLHWLGEWESVEYFDDAEGGVEANCLLNLKLRSGAEGTVELSRTRRLRGTGLIYGKVATVEVATWGNRLSLSPTGTSYIVRGEVTNQDTPTKIQGDVDKIREELQDWCNAIEFGRPCQVSGAEGIRSIRLIETCYRNARPLRFAWD